MTAIPILHNSSPRELRQCQIDGPLIIERRERPSAKASFAHFLQVDLGIIILGNRRRVSVILMLFTRARTRAYTHSFFILCSNETFYRLGQKWLAIFKNFFLHIKVHKKFKINEISFFLTFMYSYVQCFSYNCFHLWNDFFDCNQMRPNRF